MCFFFFFKQKTADEMRISDWSSDVCSSDLTGKSDAAIDQQQLAVIAQVEMQRGRPQAQRIETRNVNAGLFQATTDPWPRIALASVVDQHLDLHATRLGLRQRGDKLLADCVVVEDVSAKPDRLACGGDRRPHPRS